MEKLDPNFALAYVGVSESYNVMPSYPYMSPNEANPLAKAAVAIQTRFPGRMATRFGGKTFGGINVDEVYIYPSPLPAPVP